MAGRVQKVGSQVAPTGPAITSLHALQQRIADEKVRYSCWVAGCSLHCMDHAPGIPAWHPLVLLPCACLMQPPLEEVQAGLDAAVGTLLAALAAQGLATASLVRPAL